MDKNIQFINVLLYQEALLYQDNLSLNAFNLIIGHIINIKM